MTTRFGLVVCGFIATVGTVGWPGLALAQPTPKNRAATPVPRFYKEDEKRCQEYILIHENRIKTLAARKPEVLFIGDSITQGWNGIPGKDIWQERFAPLKAYNIGNSGDRTQFVLWRIVNGEFACKPKAAVVMIGTNNQWYDPAEDIPEGVAEVVRAIRKESPNTRVLLMSILPRGNKLPNPNNDKSIAVNRAIAKLADGKSVWFIDIYDKYLKDGQLNKDLFHDDTHLTAKGYQIWADAITPRLTELVRGN
ncbi:MAG: hypothetical protein K2R98_23065 [Gemmataceae bacterium]|nr:hypothetical protein [Gemmataceae bacterium]